MDNKALLFACIFVLVSCSGGGSSTKPINNAGDNEKTDGSDGGSTNATTINSFPLAKPAKALAEIALIPGMRQVDAEWIVGNWAASSQLNMSGRYDRSISMTDYLYSFDADGTFSDESVKLGVSEDAVESSSGSWAVYLHLEADRYYLFLSVDDSYVLDYPLERDGENTLRIQRKYKLPLERSKLLTRLGSASSAIYPGMGLLGTFQYKDYFGDDDKYLYEYEFSDDNQVTRHIYGDYSYNYALQSSVSGTWSITNEGQTLQLDLNGEGRTDFAIGNASEVTVVMTDVAQDDQRWVKTKEPTSVGVYSPIAGEYRERDGDSYINIIKNGSDYLVDVWPEYSNDGQYLSISATSLGNDELSFTIPAGGFNEGKEVTLKVSNNKLQFVERPGTFFVSTDIFDKVSSHPRYEYNNSIIGGWSHALWHTTRGYSYEHYLDNGTYYANVNNGYYGDYEQIGDQLKLQVTCESPEYRALSNVSGNLKQKDITYGPIPGTAALGQAGSEITRIMFEHAYDRYGLENAPKLKAHPSISHAFLYEEEVRYDAIHANFTLKPDGTGSFFSGSVEYYEDVFTGDWLGSQTTGGSFDTEYFVIREQSKEYLVYYYTGAFFGDYNNIATLGSVEGNIKDAKIAEIYNRRTAICYQYQNPGDGSGVIMPLVK